MTETSLAKTVPSIPELTIQQVKAYINPKVSDNEAYVFLQLCKAEELNPFLKQCHLVKYSDSEPASMVVDYKVFIARAERNPAYRGFKAGIIVLDAKNTVVYREGSFYLPGEQIVGGWCEVYRTDRAIPIRTEVSFSEYAQYKAPGVLNRTWNAKSGTMIRKVAVGQGHRDAFPDKAGRLYLAEEFGASAEELPDYEIGKHPTITSPTGAEFRAPTQTQPAAQKAAQPTGSDATTGTSAGAQASAGSTTETGELATEPQVKKIAICLKELGLTTDDEKHEYASVILAKAENIKSIKDLTKREASTLIEALVKNIAAAAGQKK